MHITLLAPPVDMAIHRPWLHDQGSLNARLMRLLPLPSVCLVVLVVHLLLISTSSTLLRY